MTRISRTIVVASCLAVLGLSVSQPPDASSATPTFEAADVHVSPERLHPEFHGKSHGDRLTLSDATMVDLISSAYEVDPADVVGGPPWLEFDRFDINAKAAATTSNAAAMEMLRALLADRFKLVAHTDKRPLPAFILSAGKVTKLKKADTAAQPGGCDFQAPPPNSAPSTPLAPGTPPPPMNVKFSCHNTSMETFAEFLRNVASPYLNRPVVDKTGLQGGWDFDLQWTYRKPGDGSGISIFDAVDKQLGLKLESKTTPTTVLVVDSVNEKPTSNIPGIEKLLPPPPAAEFEVAVIRLANPTEKNFNIDIEGNRVNVLFATLQTLVYYSYDIPPGRIENKPKWLDDQHYDIMGKVSTDLAPNPIPGAGASLDIDDVKEMLRSLLADRFKLTTHAGTRDSTVYAMVAENPKMKKADPANHPSCHEGPGPDGKDPRLDNPLLNRLISCQNMTMPQLAIELHSLVSGYVPAPVIDSTGLAGAYDFSLSFSKKGAVRNAAAATQPSSGDASATPLASDPIGSGISLFDAMQKQLGLKLEKKDKVPVATLVIDHIEEKPTEN